MNREFNGLLSLVAEFLGFCHHRSEHLTNPCAFPEQDLVFFCGDVSAGSSCVQPMLCCSLFSVCICQLAHEMSYIAALLPCFSKVRPDGPRRPSDLISQSI